MIGAIDGLPGVAAPPGPGTERGSAFRDELNAAIGASLPAPVGSVSPVTVRAHRGVPDDDRRDPLAGDAAAGAGERDEQAALVDDRHEQAGTTVVLAGALALSGATTGTITIGEGAPGAPGTSGDAASAGDRGTVGDGAAAPAPVRPGLAHPGGSPEAPVPEMSAAPAEATDPHPEPTPGPESGAAALGAQRAGIKAAPAGVIPAGPRRGRAGAEAHDEASGGDDAPPAAGDRVLAGPGVGQPDAAGRGPVVPPASAGDGSAGGSVSAGVLRSEHVRQLRELAPNREVQRLAVDLDGARVAVRVDDRGARLRVLADPAERLGGSWTTDVQRSLNTVLRHQPASYAGHHDQHHGGRRERGDHPDEPAPRPGGEDFSRRLGEAGRTTGA